MSAGRSGAALAFAGALVAAVAAFMPWVATSAGMTLDGFHYEGVYVSGGIGSSLVLVSVFAGLLALALLVARGTVKAIITLLCSGCGVLILLLVAGAASNISERVQCAYWDCSLSGGSTQTGVWIAALGGVAVIVGSVLAGFMKEPTTARDDPSAGHQLPTKVCPMCAEEVRAEARICRFCRYEFPSAGTPAGEAAGSPAFSAPPAEPPPPYAAPYSPPPPGLRTQRTPPGEGPWVPPPRPPDQPRE